ncbi:MAG: hypothetical protein PUD22_01415 [Erysipelotrichaceae bacterium]|nr:hypothetical protein [Erysipelotrichaceae bacterium]
MDRYGFYYKDIFLGTLLVNDNGCHSFIKDGKGIKQAMEETVLPIEVSRGTDGFTKPIPFFVERIYYMNKFKLTEIRLHTDYFVLVKEDHDPVY